MDQTTITLIRRAIRALRLEHRRGCGDSVPGGVEEMLRHLAGQLAAAVPEPAQKSLRRL